MANSSIVPADLMSGRCTSTAEVRLLRFWEARNLKRCDLSGETLNHLTMEITWAWVTSRLNCKDLSSSLPVMVPLQLLPHILAVNKYTTLLIILSGASNTDLTHCYFVYFNRLCMPTL
ncbi:LOW QUALITY PROTEIN: hypothetical protein HID58_048195, partial [Brassica napus]